MEPVWNELKSLIKNASPDLYESISEMSFSDFEQTSGRIKISVFKYFNRARYRATPFGGFASFSTLYLQNFDSHEHLLAGQPEQHIFTNWADKDMVSDLLKKGNHLRSFISNPMLYIADKRVKYLYFNYGKFELSSVELTALLKELTDFCRKEKNTAEIIKFLGDSFAMSRKEIEALLQQLVQEQILLSSDWVNITGEDYFKRVSVSESAKTVPYIITEREILNGSLNQHQFAVLAESADFLNRVLPQEINPNMEEFKQKFRARYEDYEVPLSRALDPQTGIGYGDFAGMQDESYLIRTLKQQVRNENGTSEVLNSEFYSILVNGIIGQKDIYLDSMPEISLSPKPLPNSFSAIVENWGNLLYVKYFGGATATALISRFSLASETVLNEACSFAKSETNSNPEVCFFDIAYQAEIHVDNINRRGHIYDNELSIATWNTSKGVIRLEDILISVRNGEVILRLANSDMRLVPRITSAYNTLRAELSHFRFFSDLQYEGIRANLSLDIRSIVKGLNKYPRVMYKNLLLSPAIFRVPEAIIADSSVTLPVKLQRLSKWLGRIGLDNFKYGRGDQTLLFSRKNKDDLRLFLATYRTSLSEYITEAFINSDVVVKNELSDSFLPEFVINLQHNNEVYHNAGYGGTMTPEAFHPPGSEWLYMEIYCHPIDADRLLLAAFNDVISANRPLISRWFFVRYSNPKFHIRLRIKTSEPWSLLKQFSSLFSRHIASGIISDYQLKPYFPEISRYGQELMQRVETFFYQDSRWVIDFVKRGANDMFRYVSSVYLLDEAFAAHGYSIEERGRFSQRMSAAFADEFQLKNDAYKIVNKYYSEFAGKLDKEKNAARTTDKKRHGALLQFIALLKYCETSLSGRLAADLFHMHINRLFSSEQRMHEMIIYIFYQKYLKAQQYK